jgi:hypothetical protein
MKKIIPALAVLLFVTAATAYWMYPTAESTDSTGHTPATAATASSLPLDGSAPVGERLAALEQAVRTERQARQLLQEEVVFLTGELSRLTIDDSGQTEDVPDIAPIANVLRSNSRLRNSAENRADRLVAGGFTQGEADWIIRRESELRMESLQARYDADRNGTQQDFLQSRQATANGLRQELGDADYERYLTSNGRSTRVAVSSVLESSPAQTAGLQTGDEIINYDGQRVFSMSDLVSETLRGELGQNVAVDFMRDGVQMQVVIARGPFGIMGGRRSLR